MQVVIFSYQDKFYGIPSKHVEEITVDVKWTEVPKTANWLLGLINLRGNIISLLDFGNLLNLKDDVQEVEELCYNNTIIVTTDKDKVALAVDTVQEVVDIDESEIQLSKFEDNVIKGVYIRNESVINFVDLDALISENVQAV